MPKSELSHTQKLAGVLHDLKCRGNNTEMCAWWYRNDPLNDNNNWETKIYMEMAQKFEKRPLKEVIDFLKDLFGNLLVEEALRANDLLVPNTP